MPIREEDRMNVIRVVGGDTWTIDLNLFDPRHPERPATPDNTKARVVLSETQFEDPIWSGEWYSGIQPDVNRPGLCHIRIPRAITSMLRRGSYLFSVRVCDPLMSEYSTEATGTFLVEYAPTGEQHSIPYKDGTRGGGSIDEKSEEKSAERIPDGISISDSSTGMAYTLKIVDGTLRIER